MKDVVNATIHVILALSIAVCLYILSGLSAEVRDNSTKHYQTIETIGTLSEVVVTNTENMVTISKVLNGLSENDAFVAEVVKNVIKNLPPIVVETEADLEEAIEAANEAIAEVSEAIGELQGEPLTFDQVEALLDAALEAALQPDSVVTEEPEPVLVNKPTPNKEVSDEKLKELVKKEVYGIFVKAGYGKIVNGELVLKRPFYGAEIIEGDEGRYEPTAPLK